MPLHYDCAHPSTRRWQPHGELHWCLTCGAIQIPALSTEWSDPQLPDDPSAFMSTISNREILLLEPRAEDVDVHDIAHHLAMQPRFLGAIRFFYGLGEHSINVMHATYALMGGEGDARVDGFRIPSGVEPWKFWGALLRALFHDGSEAYLGDCIRPLKRLLPIYRQIEARHMRAIHTALGLGPEEKWASIDEFVSTMDLATYDVENAMLRHGPKAKIPGVQVEGLAWDGAREAFHSTALALLEHFAPYREAG